MKGSLLITSGNLSPSLDIWRTHVHEIIHCPSLIHFLSTLQFTFDPSAPRYSFHFQLDGSDNLIVWAGEPFNILLFMIHTRSHAKLITLTQRILFRCFSVVYFQFSVSGTKIFSLPPPPSPHPPKSHKNPLIYYSTLQIHRLIPRNLCLCSTTALKLDDWCVPRIIPPFYWIAGSLAIIISLDFVSPLLRVFLRSPSPADCSALTHFNWGCSKSTLWRRRL